MRRKQPFQLSVSARMGKTYAGFVRRQLKRARSQLQAPLGQLAVIFVNDVPMSRLHDRFMGMATPTDVLTFPIDEDARGRPLTGEVYVCIPEARRQARRRGIPVAWEVLLYALHGMLHLCGFDDRTDPEYRRMHRREDQILMQLGIGKVFAKERERRVSSGPPLKARGRRKPS